MENKENILKEINARCKATLMGTLDIRFVDFGEDYLISTMPITDKVRQPMGILHGGASVALAESTGSCLSNLNIDEHEYYAVGTQIDANHLRAASEGLLTCTARMIRKGRNLHVSQMEIIDEENRLICLVTMTNMVIKKP